MICSISGRGYCVCPQLLTELLDVLLKYRSWFLLILGVKVIICLNLFRKYINVIIKCCTQLHYEEGKEPISLMLSDFFPHAAVKPSFLSLTVECSPTPWTATGTPRWMTCFHLPDTHRLYPHKLAQDTEKLAAWNIQSLL